MPLPLAPTTAHALASANHEAKRLGSARLEPAHVLLGLCAADPSLAPALRRCGTVDLRGLRLQVEWLTRNAPRGLRRDVLPPSAATRRLMIDAAGEAGRFGHQEVAAEHLLAALLRDDSATPAEALRRCGVQTAVVCQILDDALGAWFQPPTPATALPLGSEGVLAYESPAVPAANVAADAARISRSRAVTAVCAGAVSLAIVIAWVWATL
jgi:ATP-dependent Clp protease ATP-binding subunit ClpA